MMHKYHIPTKTIDTSNKHSHDGVHDGVKESRNLLAGNQNGTHPGPRTKSRKPDPSFKWSGPHKGLANFTLNEDAHKREKCSITIPMENLSQAVDSETETEVIKGETPSLSVQTKKLLLLRQHARQNDHSRRTNGERSKSVFDVELALRAMENEIEGLRYEFSLARGGYDPTFENFRSQTIERNKFCRIETHGIGDKDALENPDQTCMSPVSLRLEIQGSIQTSCSDITDSNCSFQMNDQQRIRQLTQTVQALTGDLNHYKSEVERMQVHRDELCGEDIQDNRESDNKGDTVGLSRRLREEQLETQKSCCLQTCKVKEEKLKRQQQILKFHLEKIREERDSLITDIKRERKKNDSLMQVLCCKIGSDSRNAPTNLHKIGEFKSKMREEKKVKGKKSRKTGRDLEKNNNFQAKRSERHKEVQTLKETVGAMAVQTAETNKLIDTYHTKMGDKYNCEKLVETIHLHKENVSRLHAIGKVLEEEMLQSEREANVVSDEQGISKQAKKKSLSVDSRWNHDSLLWEISDLQVKSSFVSFSLLGLFSDAILRQSQLREQIEQQAVLLGKAKRVILRTIIRGEYMSNQIDQKNGLDEKLFKTGDNGADITPNIDSCRKLEALEELLADHFKEESSVLSRLKSKMETELKRQMYFLEEMEQKKDYEMAQEYAHQVRRSIMEADLNHKRTEICGKETVDLSEISTFYVNGEKSSCSLRREVDVDERITLFSSLSQGLTNAKKVAFGSLGKNKVLFTNVDEGNSNSKKAAVNQRQETSFTASIGKMFGEDDYRNGKTVFGKTTKLKSADDTKGKVLKDLHTSKDTSLVMQGEEGIDFSVGKWAIEEDCESQEIEFGDAVSSEAADELPTIGNVLKELRVLGDPTLAMHNNCVPNAPTYETCCDTDGSSSDESEVRWT